MFAKSAKIVTTCKWEHASDIQISVCLQIKKGFVTYAILFSRRKMRFRWRQKKRKSNKREKREKEERRGKTRGLTSGTCLGCGCWRARRRARERRWR